VGRYRKIKMMRIDILFFKDFIYLFDRASKRRSRGSCRQREREKQVSHRAEGPMWGSIPGTPRS